MTIIQMKTHQLYIIKKRAYVVVFIESNGTLVYTGMTRKTVFDWHDLLWLSCSRYIRI